MQITSERGRKMASATHKSEPDEAISLMNNQVFPAIETAY
jgi:hypothetical protein